MIRSSNGGKQKGRLLFLDRRPLEFLSLKVS